MRTTLQSAWRFVLVGMLNTILGYCFFLALAIWLPSAIAYAISYAIGIVIAIVLNLRWAFREPLSAAAIVLTACVYLLTMALVTAGVAYGDAQGFPAYVLGACATAASVILNFIGMRLVARRSVRGRSQ